MNKQEKLKEILFSEFDKLIEGADIYDHRGSKWIIFTNEKRWVVEFTKEKTLWFNYHRFNEVLVLFAMDCNEDRDYIKEWYERRFIFNHKVENDIQNGVRSTAPVMDKAWSQVDNTIQNGVVVTRLVNSSKIPFVKKVIQNGVRTTQSCGIEQLDLVEDTIQNGVKDTNYRLVFDQQGIECAIENNINELDPRFFQLDGIVEDTIKNGIKRVGGVKRDRKERIDLIIEKGEKL